MTRHSTIKIVGLALLGAMLVAALHLVEDGPAATSRRVAQQDSQQDSSPAFQGQRVSSRAASAPAIDVLRGWDRRRADAYARGDMGVLRKLYVPESNAGAADVRLLREYLERGFRVTGMGMQLLAVEVLGHHPNRWRLRVTDRLRGAVAARRGARVELPRDLASTRVVTLRRSSVDAPWQVAAVV